MKKLYESPAVEVTAFMADDILTASAVTFGGVDYEVVPQGAFVNDGGVQRVNEDLFADF